MTISPYPWFGGKSRVAEEVWARLGDVPNLVDPFLGSNALLLARPDWDWAIAGWPDDTTRIETVNDADGFIANFWRAVSADPEQVAHYADHPVNENDLHARHIWLVNRREDITARLEGDPDWYDAKIAGWWVWGLCCWIGSGWCSGRGPWSSVDGQLVHLGDAGQGVHRQLVHLGNAGQGVHRQVDIYDWFEALAQRLRGVRVCCGDWTRVLGPTPTTKQGLTAVLLDPPYSQDERDGNLYSTDEAGIAAAVRDWAVAHGDDLLLRIVLFGYDGEHRMPETWDRVAWKAQGGYGSQGDGRGRENAAREVVWFSPHCLRPERPRQLGLFAEVAP